MLSVLDRAPLLAAPAPYQRSASFDTSPSRFMMQAPLNRSGPMTPGSNGATRMPSGRRPGLPFLQLTSNRRMAAILDFDPVLLPAAAVRPIAVLRDQPLQAHAAGRAVQIRTDLAPLEWRHGDPVRRPR